jgi:quinol monooxygenase YgiN
MSIVYIGQSQARPEAIDRFRDFLTAVVAPAIRASAGSESYQVLQSQDDPTRFIGIEVWESIDAHRASVKNIPPQSIDEFRKLVAGPPSGGYYRAV